MGEHCITFSNPNGKAKRKVGMSTRIYTSSLLSAFGPISTILYAFSKVLTEIPMNKGSLSNTDKP